MAEKKPIKKCITPYFRASFPNLFHPAVSKFDKNKEGGKAQYSVTAIWPKGADLSDLRALIRQAIVEKWGENKEDWPEGLMIPLLRAENKAKKVNGVLVFPDGYEAGGFYANLKNKNNQPGIIDGKKNPITDEMAIYSGVWLRACVSAWAFENGRNKGVSLNILSAQKWKDDSPLGTKSNPAEDFSEIETEDGAEVIAAAPEAGDDFELPETAPQKREDIPDWLS